MRIGGKRNELFAEKAINTVKSTVMETFKAAFLAKYPKCGIVLDYFREATDKPMAWGNLSRLNLSLFITHMGETHWQDTCRQKA